MTAVVWLAAGAWPVLVALAAALAAGTWWSVRAARRERAALGPRAARLAGRRAFVRTRAGCALAAATAAGVALLQPAWGLEPGAPAGADVVVCLDVSRSMAARDAAPSRLAAAQRQIAELAAAAPSARLGLVVFAGEARLAAPLTPDLAAVAALAAAATPTGGGTDLGAAIDRAAAALARGGAGGGAIVVLGDGEDFAAGGAAAARRAQQAGAVVHCLGFGSEAGSKIAVDTPAGEVFLRAAGGDEIVTRLDLARLAATAREGGGRCERAREGALVRLYERDLAPRAADAAVRDGRAVPRSRHPWFLCAAWLFWMLRACLPERRR